MGSAIDIDDDDPVAIDNINIDETMQEKYIEEAIHKDRQ